MLVNSKDLYSGGTLDFVILGQVAVFHHIDCAKLDLFVRELGITLSSFVLRRKWFAVGTPVSVEGDHPQVFIVIDDHLFEVRSIKLLNILKEGKGLSGKHCEAEKFHLGALGNYNFITQNKF